jgi:ABC-2 type transport system permease protein
MSGGNGFGIMLRRQLRVNRMSLAVMTVLIAVFSVAQIQTYVSAFPDAAVRDALLLPFADNGALRVLYGYPFDITDVTGWVAWRAMSVNEIIMAAWALIIVSGALRGEEDAGRAELTLSRPQPRTRWFTAALTAAGVETLCIGGFSVLAMAAVGLPQHLMSFANCVELGLQLVLPALLFGAVGALAGQLLGTVRGARIAAAAALAVAFMIRAVADTSAGVAWLRWLSPLGWFEELRPPQAPSLAALLAPVSGTVVLAAVCLPMLATRDIGRGLLPQRDSRAPRRQLLGSSWQAALRTEIPQLLTWLAATIATAVLMGGLLKTVLNLVNGNPDIVRVMGRSIGADGFVAAMFSLVQLVAALLTVALVVSARGEESTGRLELLLAMPRSRIGWLCGRVLLAAVAAGVLTLAAGGAMWAGAAMTGQAIGFGGVLVATGNSLPVIAVTAGVVTFVLGLAPRAVSFVYALVAVAYLWDTIGAALRMPEWSLNLSPFHALAQVPIQDFAPLPAAVLSLLGVALLLFGLAAFRGRDLATG